MERWCGWWPLSGLETLLASAGCLLDVTIYVWPPYMTGIVAVNADPKTIGGIWQQKYPDVLSSIGKLKDNSI